jgi:hypothetical protein
MGNHMHEISAGVGAWPWRAFRRQPGMERRLEVRWTSVTWEEFKPV